MKSKTSRFEVNKQVRQILARHGTDTTLVEFQCYGQEISIGGILWHNDNSDFNGSQVEALVQDLTAAFPGFVIRGQTENWVFNNQSLQRLHGVLEEGDIPMIDEAEIIIGEGGTEE